MTYQVHCFDFITHDRTVIGEFEYMPIGDFSKDTYTKMGLTKKIGLEVFPEMRSGGFNRGLVDFGIYDDKPRFVLKKVLHAKEKP